MKAFEQLLLADAPCVGVSRIKWKPYLAGLPMIPPQLATFAERYHKSRRALALVLPGHTLQNAPDPI